METATVLSVSLLTFVHFLALVICTGLATILDLTPHGVRLISLQMGGTNSSLYVIVLSTSHLTLQNFYFCKNSSENDDLGLAQSKAVYLTKVQDTCSMK